jgi:hypothetical protein
MVKSRVPVDPYHSFDLDDQAVDALAMTAAQLTRVEAEPAAWKWVVIALHQALHGFMGLALERSDGAQLLSQKHERATYERWHRERELGHPLPFGAARVDEFLNLYQKIQDSQRMGYFVHSRPLDATADQNDSVKYLNGLRNDLAHYSATTLIVHVADLPQVVLDSLSVISFLVLDSNTIFLNPDELHARVIELLDQLELDATRLASWYFGATED